MWHRLEFGACVQGIFFSITSDTLEVDSVLVANKATGLLGEKVFWWMKAHILLAFLSTQKCFRGLCSEVE